MHGAIDRLTQLGPRCTIASLSLGATRLFRMRKTVAGEGEADDPGAGPKNNAGGSPQATPTRSANGAATQVGFASIDVLLPHNTLVVMFPPAQEEWKHEVHSFLKSKLMWPDSLWFCVVMPQLRIILVTRLCNVLIRSH